MLTFQNEAQDSSHKLVSKIQSPTTSESSFPQEEERINFE